MEDAKLKINNNQEQYWIYWDDLDREIEFEEKLKNGNV